MSIQRDMMLLYLALPIGIGQLDRIVSRFENTQFKENKAFLFISKKPKNKKPECY